LIILKTKGIYSEGGDVVLNSIKTIRWMDISEEIPPQLPAGTNINLEMTLDENEFLSGKNGIVWATYDLRQAEIIQSTLLAQQINCEINKISLELEHELKSMFLIIITNKIEVQNAIDFIWKGDGGLRLKPDWHYGKGEKNKSLEQWLSGQ
jgi:hypothetical protein